MGVVLVVTGVVVAALGEVVVGVGVVVVAVVGAVEVVVGVPLLDPKAPSNPLMLGRVLLRYSLKGLLLDFNLVNSDCLCSSSDFMELSNAVP